MYHSVILHSVRVCTVCLDNTTFRGRIHHTLEASTCGPFKPIILYQSPSDIILLLFMKYVVLMYFSSLMLKEECQFNLRGLKIVL